MGFAELALEEFDDFNQRDDQEGKTEGNEVLGCVQVSEAEEAGQEVNLNNGGSQQERSDHCTVQCPVVVTLEDHANRRVSLRTHIERVEDLTHCHRKERHGHTVRTVGDVRQ